MKWGVHTKCTRVVRGRKSEPIVAPAKHISIILVVSVRWQATIIVILLYQDGSPSSRVSNPHLWVESRALLYWAIATHITDVQSSRLVLPERFIGIYARPQ